MGKLKNIYALISLLFVPVSVFLAQNTDTTSIYKYEQLLTGLFNNLYNINNNSEKERINNEIIKNFKQALAIKESFTFPFDSLKNTGKIVSPDKRLRLYTWNIPFSDGTHKYFGFIQYYPLKAKDFAVYRLTDKKNSIESPEEKTLSDTNWFGALYYEIIETRHEGNTYYTLLGFDFNNFLTSKKVVELLYFRNDSIPVFGKPVFNYQNRLLNRIIFEYSSKVSMSLKYNKDLKMIIFDHLSPSKPSYKDHFMFYGPDFSYNGLEFKDGIWNEIHDVDVRNPVY
jgi:hypothetical protein